MRFQKIQIYQFLFEKKVSHAITLIGIWAWGVPIACLFYAACLIESSHAGHPSHGSRIARFKKSASSSPPHVPKCLRNSDQLARKI